jgi:hypothetical protein
MEWRPVFQNQREFGLGVLFAENGLTILITATVLVL